MKAFVLAIAAALALCSAALAQTAPRSYSPEEVVAAMSEVDEPQVQAQPVAPPVRPQSVQPARVAPERPAPAAYVVPQRTRTSPGFSGGSGSGLPELAPSVEAPQASENMTGWTYDARVDRRSCQLRYGRPRFVAGYGQGYQGCYIPPGGLAQPEARPRPMRRSYQYRPFRPIYQPRRH